MVKLLLEKHADVNIRNKNGDTPLHIAASKGLIPIVELFIEYGANPNIKNASGQVPCDLLQDERIKKILQCD